MRIRRKTIGRFVAGGTAVLIVLAGWVLSCNTQEERPKISLEKRGPANSRQEVAQRPLRIAVGGMITPRAGYRYYRELLDYIGKKMDRPVEFVDRADYAEINKLVETGDVDVAFVCGGPYVDGKMKFGMELLAAPWAYGGTVYYSYIIVPKRSRVEHFRELRGKRFAFTDPLSNSGKLVPEYMLTKMGETADTFFKEYVYTSSHDNSIKAVAEGIVDGAAVDSLIWEYEDRTAPQYTSQTRVIEKSPPYGIPPVVVSPRVEAGTKLKLRNLFLSLHEDEKGREILSKMMIDRFVLIEDSAYDSIREMKRHIAH